MKKHGASNWFFFCIQSEGWYLNIGLKSHAVWTRRAVLRAAPMLCRSLSVLNRCMERGRALCGTLCLAVAAGGSRRTHQQTPQWSDVGGGAHTSPGFAVGGTDTKGDGAAAAVAPACPCQLRVFPRVPQSLSSTAGRSLTVPHCLSTAAVGFARWITAVTEGPEHYSVHFWCVSIPRFAATVKSKAKSLW